MRDYDLPLEELLLRLLRLEIRKHPGMANIKRLECIAILALHLCLFLFGFLSEHLLMCFLVLDLCGSLLNLHPSSG